MKSKRFLLTILTVYLLVSIPDMLGIGYVEIEWVKEATFLQKLKEMVWNGLTKNFLYKMIIAIGVGIFIILKSKISNRL